MFISRKRWEALEKRVTELEKVQGQSSTISSPETVLKEFSSPIREEGKLDHLEQRLLQAIIGCLATAMDDSFRALAISVIAAVLSAISIILYFA